MVSIQAKLARKFTVFLNEENMIQSLIFKLRKGSQLEFCELFIVGKQLSLFDLLKGAWQPKAANRA